MPGKSYRDTNRLDLNLSRLGSVSKQSRSKLREQSQPAAGGSTVVTDFTGADGTGPPSPWIEHNFNTGSGAGSSQILSNEWHMDQASGYAGNTMTYGTTSYTDVDVKVKVRLNSFSVEQYPLISARMSGGTDGWWDPYGELNNGYSIFLNPNSSTVHLQSTSGTTGADIATAVSQSFSAGSTWWMRLRCEGTTISGKYWQDGSAEPGSWTWQVTNSDWSSGTVGFRDQAADTVANSYWDDYSITDLTASSGTNYSDDVTTTIVSATEETDLLAMTENLTTTVVGVTSVTDSRAMLENVNTTVVGVTSETDLLAMFENCQTDVTAVTSETDTFGFNESLLTTAVVTSSSEDTATFNDTLTTIAVGITEVSDVGVLNDNVVITVAGVTSLDTDRVDMLASVQTDVTGVTSVTDLFSYNENVQTTIQGVTSETDSLAATEALQTNTVGTTSTTDQAAFADSVTSTGSGTTTGGDSLGGLEGTVTTALGINEIIQQLAMIEDTLGLASGITSESDQATYTDATSGVIVGVTSETDELNGQGPVTPVIVYQASPWKVIGYR